MSFRPHTASLRRGLHSMAGCLAMAVFHTVPSLAGEPVVIDCHVHLWTLSRPAGIGWIKKDDPQLYRDYLPADHEAIAKANGVEGVVLVQAGQSIPDNQWNLDITAHNRKLYRGLVGNLSEVIGSDWPVSETTGDYASVLALTRGYFEAKGPGTCDKLFHRNAVRFYAIPAVD